MIQEYLGKTAPTASSRVHRPQIGPSLDTHRNWCLENLARHLDMRIGNIEIGNET